MVSDKKWNGYFTVEASFVMPLVLFLYLAILSAALLLYNRCLVSQDSFLLSMRVSRFSYAEENYGEVIYGCEKTGEWFKEDYVRDRMQGRFSFDSGHILKSVEKINPVAMIREGRKK